MTSTQTSLLATHLSNNSSPAEESMGKINWDALNHNQYWLPESMLSLYGSAEYDTLTHKQRIRLSHFELLHFIEFGLWLESIFINRLRRCIDINDASPSNTYSLHIIREEAEHSLMFLQFMERSGYSRVMINKQKLGLYEKLWSFTTVKSCLFWTFVLAGEEIPLRMNMSMLKARRNLNITVADIVKIHTLDESRHVSHASAMLGDILQKSNRLSRQTIRLLMPTLIKQFTDAFYYPMQNVYVMAGLDNNVDWEKISRSNITRQQFVEKQLENILRPLHKHGISYI